jgi:hypothetical protein
VLALLLGFLFSGATTRFDQRRDLLAHQATSITTAWQRIAPLPAPAAAEIRIAFRKYVDALVAWSVWSATPGTPRESAQRATLAGAQNELWDRAVTATLAPGGEPTRMLLLPALNEMFDLADRERFARQASPPAIIWVMVAVTALAASLFAGYAMAGAGARNRLFNIGIAATVATITFVIIDIEYPRLGIVRVDSFDRYLVELRTGLAPE